MTMRFLPWVRRGLAGAIEHQDTPGPLPATAAAPVTVRLKSDTGATVEATADLGVLGPGAVTGIDIRSIIRTEPSRHAVSVEPDGFAAIEFDQPEFPWMFTPAAAGDRNRLRPWLVLLVVEQQAGVSITTAGGPLPRLTIEAPAVPGDELPELADSWAWAHVQAITTDAAVPIGDNLTGDPDRNLSRLLCMRRLAPDRQWIAALVPAFDAGVDTGLGRTGSAPDQVGPAWDHATLGPSVTLPLYYHWRFRTGPAGDFESLARRLRPMPLPDDVGAASMHIGAAGPGVRPLTGSDAITTMEGALRSPTAPAPSPVDAGFTADLVATVDAVNAGAVDAVGPPVYGGRHVQRSTVPAPGQQPRWLRDLNAEVRHRAAAGLGVQVVRANQDVYMDEAWEQVESVLQANQLLHIAALIRRAMERLHERHVVGVDPGRLLALTAQSHRLLRFQGTSVALAHHRSSTPDALTSPAMRRALSPHNIHLKLGARRFDAQVDRTGGLQLSPAALRGELTQEIEVTPPGIIDTVDIGRVAEIVGERLDPVDRAVLADRLAAARAAEEALDGTGVSEPTLRPDLASVGVPTAAHVRLAAELAGTERTLSSVLDELRPVDATTVADDATVVGFELTDDRMLGTVLADASGQVTSVRDGRGIPFDGVVSDLLRHRLGLGGTRPPVDDRPDERPTDPFDVLGGRGGGGLGGRRGGGLGGGGGGRGGSGGGLGGGVDDILDRLRDRLPDDAADGALERLLAGRVFDRGAPQAGAIDPPVIVTPLLTDEVVLAEYRTSFERQMTTVDAVVPTVDSPAALDIPAIAATVVEQTAPGPVIAARLRSRIRIDGAGIDELARRRPPLDRPDVIDLWQPDEVSPVLVGPRSSRQLYLDLAAYDQERFLPGVGRIPDDALTLVATNPAFVEAFLVGVNHEFNRELLWNRYPTDARSTVFRSFWDNVDGSPDIEAIHRWPGANRLGTLSGGTGEGSIVLLVRGSLLKRYPNTVVYAAPATSERRVDLGADVRLPVFTGRLEPDLRFAGFDLTPAQVQAGDGWMFVLQEQPSEPRFGLDVPLPGATGVAPASWSDLSWGHAGVDPGGHLRIADLPDRTLPLADTTGSPRVTLARNAATVAAATFQRPFRAAVHASEILENA